MTTHPDSSALVFDVTADTFMTDVVEASQTTLVLVDFWANWCQPCRQLGPILENLAAEYDGRLLIAKVDTEQEQLLTGQFGIRSLPTVVFFSLGQIVDHFMGVQPEGEIRSRIEQIIGPADDGGASDEEISHAICQQAREFFAQGQPDHAIALLKQELAQSPGDAILLLGLAELQLDARDYDGATDSLAAVPADKQSGDPYESLRHRLRFAHMAKLCPPIETLQKMVISQPDNLKFRHQLAVQYFDQKYYREAMDQWLEIMRRDRKYEDDLGRRFLIEAFALVNDPPLISHYRRQMAALLF